MASKGSKLVDVVVQSRAPSVSPAKGSEVVSAALLAKLGDLILTDKEAAGLVIKEAGCDHIPKPRWTAVGKVCSPRKLIIGALEKAIVGRGASTERRNFVTLGTTDLLFILAQRGIGIML
jgi:hypothetical protein